MNTQNWKGRSPAGALLAPYSLWAVVFILVPLAFIAYYAFTDNSFQFTLDNVTRFSPPPPRWTAGRPTPIC